jgi:O-methyltransferase
MLQRMPEPGTSEGRAADLYLDLLKDTLCRWGEDEFIPMQPGGSVPRRLAKAALASVVGALGKSVVNHIPFDADTRETGRDWPARAMSMMGAKRLENIRYCVREIIRDDVPGDLVETGVWRGGGSIFMRACLEAYGDRSRVVWCADSFEGLPTPDLEKYPQDANAPWHLSPELAVSLDQVKGNFQRFRMLDDRVRFLVGWFKDTLPSAPIGEISVLRLDGDMYESTMDALCALYGRLSAGGFVIVDDYGLPEDTCRRAIHDFRDANGITEPIIDIDGYGAYWRRTS